MELPNEANNYEKMVFLRRRCSHFPLGVMFCEILSLSVSWLGCLVALANCNCDNELLLVDVVYVDIQLNFL